MCEPEATITGLCAEGDVMARAKMGIVLFPTLHSLFSEIKIINNLLLLSAFSARGMCQSLTTLPLR